MPKKSEVFFPRDFTKYTKISKDLFFCFLSYMVHKTFGTNFVNVKIQLSCKVEKTKKKITNQPENFTSISKINQNFNSLNILGIIG